MSLSINIYDVTITSENLASLDIYFLSNEYLTLQVQSISLPFVLPSATVINVIVE